MPCSEGSISATYYDDLGFASPRATRLDPTISFSLSTAATDRPSLTLPSGTSFSVRWTGMLRATTAGVYTFTVTVAEVDERVRLWVDGTAAISAWGGGGTVFTGTVGVGVANGYYEVRMEYEQETGAKSVGLLFQSSAVTGVRPVAPSMMWNTAGVTYCSPTLIVQPGEAAASFLFLSCQCVPLDMRGC